MMEIDIKIDTLIIKESDMNNDKPTEKIDFGWIESYNSEIYEIQARNILVPIRDIVLGDLSFAQKV